MLLGATLLGSGSLLLCGEEHVDEAHGFAIEVPDGWVHSSAQLSPDNWTFAVAPAGGSDALGVTIAISSLAADQGLEFLTDAARQRILGSPDVYSGLAEREVRLADRAAPAMRLEFESESGTLAIDARFLVEAGFGYTLQCHAPVEEFEARAEDLEHIVASFRTVPIPESERRRPELDALAQRCGSEVSWAADWEQAVERATRERRLIVMVVFEYGGFALPDTPRHLLFTDPDVIELIEQRFVPLWYSRAMASPLRETYGLGPRTFGQGLLICTPEGELVGETEQSSRPDFAYPFLIQALASCPEASGSPQSPGQGPEDSAALSIARGELDRALELLEGSESGAALRLRARVARLQRRGTDALRALDAAVTAGDQPADELSIERAELLMRLQRDDAAAEALEAVLDDRREQPETSATRAEALYLRGLLELRNAGPERARETWETLVERAPDSRWAWQAAAELLGLRLELGIVPSYAWPDACLVEEVVQRPAAEPRKRSELDTAVGEALDWLLAHQRPDGSWIHPSEAGSAAQLGPNPMTDATTALALRALVRHRGTPEVDAAAAGALKFLIGSIERRGQQPPVTWFMDYNPWSNAMMLHALSSARDARVDGSAGASAAIRALLADTESRQVQDGGWSYYVTADLDSGASAPSSSISFTTAAVVLGLARAREAGVRVPDELLAPSVQALLRSRDENGVFPYFLVGRDQVATATTDPRGEVGRGPACQLALELEREPRRARDTDARDARLRASIDTFLEHLPLFSAERGKVLMHAGPQGQGCHYLLFDLLHAALAQEQLAAHPETRARLLEAVLDGARADGSFLDTPILGRACGTSMALIAIDALGV